ncbi:pili assembly chaperone [Pseudoalteromonas porphyrae]|uniref:Type II secretion system protein H n=2 Tax=Pseudoalteromonas TaxID=53246 RepID=A0A0N1MQS1_9GAMM|nr:MULTISPECIES: GspH/FimT family pseudopilin [Pseudoalteromonas]KPH56843.1 pili assembly chaperone [Pseudoalteromonas porphyrae]KPH93003.1 pili assembly chaperone [Pseudoalteromonas porphyrae]NMR27551.1 prepilin-type N-terminal cleavage/methylation domain-containing protein [Pseudoalteromonas sp. NEC-BIFX-2020_015]NNG44226.1 prepilin-type N-terminal cleavage/methylation domain-containing protein [Pseudoalteromonas sp. NEC-BIFX-2020_002]
MNKTAGFTLVELMVVVSIIGIMAVLAFPSFSQQIMQDRVVTTANQLNSVYKYARSEAVKRDKDVTLAVSGTKWQVRAPVDGVETVLKEFVIQHQGVTVSLVNRTVLSTGEISAASTILVEDTSTDTVDYYLCILKSGQNWLIEKSVGCA